MFEHSPAFSKSGASQLRVASEKPTRPAPKGSSTAAARRSGSKLPVDGGRGNDERCAGLSQFPNGFLKATQAGNDRNIAGDTAGGVTRQVCEAVDRAERAQHERDFFQDDQRW